MATVLRRQWLTEKEKVDTDGGKGAETTTAVIKIAIQSLCNKPKKSTHYISFHFVVIIFILG